MEQYYAPSYRNDSQNQLSNPARPYHPTLTYPLDKGKQSTQRAEEAQAALTLLSLPMSPTSTVSVSLPPIQAFDQRDRNGGITLPPIVPRKGYYKPETDSSPPQPPRPPQAADRSPVSSNSRPGSSRGVNISQLSHSPPHYQPHPHIPPSHVLLQSVPSRPSSSRDGIPSQPQLVSLPPPPSQSSVFAHDYLEHENNRLLYSSTPTGSRKRKRISTPSVDEFTYPMPHPQQSLPPQHQHIPHTSPHISYAQRRTSTSQEPPPSHPPTSSWVHHPDRGIVIPTPPQLHPQQQMQLSPRLHPSPRMNVAAEYVVAQSAHPGVIAPPLPPPPVVARVATSDDQTKCICVNYNTDYGTPMVQCDTCFSWLHCACVGFSETAAVPDKWACPRCTGAGASAGPSKGRGGRKKKEKEDVPGSANPTKRKRQRRGTVNVNTTVANATQDAQMEPLASMPLSSAVPIPAPIAPPHLLPPPPIIPPSMFPSRASHQHLQHAHQHAHQHQHHPHHQHHTHPHLDPLQPARSQSPTHTPMTSSVTPTLNIHQLSPQPPPASPSPEEVGSPLDPNTPMTYLPIERDIVHPDASPIMDRLKQKLVKRKERGRKIESAIWDGREDESDEEDGLLAIDEDEDVDIDVEGIDPTSLEPTEDGFVQVRRFREAPDQAHDIRPPMHALHAAKPLQGDSFLSPYTSEVVPSAEYLADPLNAYAATGLPKPYVRLMPELTLDARKVGNDARWARTGCHPNAVLRPVICKEKKGDREADAADDIEVEPSEEKTDGVEVRFALYSTKELVEGEEIVLGWEWDDGHVIHQLPSIIETRYEGMGIRNHARTRLKATMKAFLDSLTASFQFCACGAKARDCAVNQLASFVEDRESPPPTPESGTNKRKPDIGMLVGAQRGVRTTGDGPGRVKFISAKNRKASPADGPAPVRNKGGRPRKRAASPKLPIPSTEAALPPRAAFMRNHQAEVPSAPERRDSVDVEEARKLPAIVAPSRSLPLGPLKLLPRLKKAWKQQPVSSKVIEPMVIDPVPGAAGEEDEEVKNGGEVKDSGDAKETSIVEVGEDAPPLRVDTDGLDERVHRSVSREASPMLVDRELKTGSPFRSRSSPLSPVTTASRPITPGLSEVRSPIGSRKAPPSPIVIDSPLMEPTNPISFAAGNGRSSSETSGTPSPNTAHLTSSIAQNDGHGSGHSATSDTVQSPVVHLGFEQQPPDSSPRESSALPTDITDLDAVPNGLKDEIMEDKLVVDDVQPVDEVLHTLEESAPDALPNAVDPAPDPPVELPVEQNQQQNPPEPEIVPPPKKTKMSFTAWKKKKVEESANVSGSTETSVSPQIGIVNGLPHSPLETPGASSSAAGAAVPVAESSQDEVSKEEVPEPEVVKEEEPKVDLPKEEEAERHQLVAGEQEQDEEQHQEYPHQEDTPHHTPPTTPPPVIEPTSSRPSSIEEPVPIAAPPASGPCTPSLLARMGLANGFSTARRDRSPPRESHRRSPASRSPARHEQDAPLRLEDVSNRNPPSELLLNRISAKHDIVHSPSSMTEVHVLPPMLERSDDHPRTVPPPRGFSLPQTTKEAEDGEIVGSSPRTLVSKNHVPPTQPRAYGRSSPTPRGRTQSTTSAATSPTTSRAPYTPSTRAPPSGPRALRQHNPSPSSTSPTRGSRDWDRDEWDRRGRERDQQQWRRGLGRGRGGWEAGSNR